MRQAQTIIRLVLGAGVAATGVSSGLKTRTLQPA